MKRFINILIISLLLISCTSRQSKELVILSVNDMHAHIEQMPKLAYIADSLRNLYPELLVVSAGDNRTGNAYSDRFPGQPNLPMINLMNAIGFEVSALGNHEFDGNIDGIRFVLQNAKFPLVCANAYFDAYPDIQIPDYVTLTKKIDGKDIKIIILGMLETSNEGRPSAHVKNLKNMMFRPAETMIDDYLYLRDSCDVFILLSHCGKESELVFAEKYPQFDMIIGGHSHDLFTKHFDNDVLYTQSKYYLKMATVTKLRFKNGKIVSKEAQVIDLDKVNKESEQIRAEVEKYYSEPYFHVVMGYAATSFNDKKALGAFMVDAQRHLTKTDIAMQNPGGIRYDSLHSGAISRADIFNLDPFNNSLVIIEMTGKQVEDFLVLASNNDKVACTHVSGITYSMKYAHSDDGQSGFVSAEAYLENGQRLDPKKVYTVTMNSYMSPWADGRCLKKEEQNLYCNDAELLFLQDNKNIDYHGVSRYNVEVLN